MKIAFLHMTLGLTDRGSERSVALLAGSLSKKHDVLILQSGKVDKKNCCAVRVFPLHQAPPSAPHCLLDKITFRLGVDLNSRLVVGFTNTCISKLKSFKPNIIVAVNGSSQVKMVKNAFPESRIVVFGHAGIGHDDAKNLCANPDLFVALTEKACSWAKKIAADSTKVVFIPNSFDPSLFHKTKPANLSLKKPIILTVGALSAYKNIPAVIKAITYLKASFILIGDGEENDKVASALSRLPNEFKWIKHLDPNEIAPYYQAADAFCFTPDPQEAFGLVYLEAMASGLPIVASNDPIRRQIVGEQGIYVNPHNTEEIASALIEAVQRDKIDYSQRLAEYKISNIVKKIEKEFYELCG